jgi:hypothetical protein
MMSVVSSSAPVGGMDGAVFRPGYLVAPVEDPHIAESAEGDGIAAAFGEEVAAESEHVRPAAQSFVTRLATERPACLDQSFGMGAAGVRVQIDGVIGDARRDVPGNLGSFCGVFSEVPGDHGIGNRVAAAHGNNPNVNLAAPFNEPPAGAGFVRWGGKTDNLGGIADGVLQIGRQS